MSKSPNKTNKLALIEGWLSIVVNVVLFALKYWIGMLTGSVAIIADAWHSLSDSVTSIIVIIGAKVSAKPADKEHPFGHGRTEIVGSIIIGVLLAVVAFDFVLESMDKLQHQESTEFGMWAIGVMVLSILLKEGMAQYAFWAARKTDSKSLKADGWHHRSDSFSSVIVLLGILFGSSYWWIDGAMGLAIAAMLFYGTYEIMKDAINTLLGEEVTEELKDNIKALAAQCCNQDLNLHHFHLHHYGNHQEITFHIKLDGQMTLEEAHEVATKLENMIREKYKLIPTIHMEPR